MSSRPTGVVSRFLRELASRQVLRLMILLVALAFLADWASKTWALGRLGNSLMPFAGLTLGVFHNEGFAFSTGHGQVSVTFVAVVRLCALVGILFVSRKYAHMLSRRSAYGVALVVAGGVGNVADLIFRGAVVDFIGAGPFEIGSPGGAVHMHVVFNTADVFILVGIVMMARGIHQIAQEIRKWLLAWERRVMGTIDWPLG